MVYCAFIEDLNIYSTISTYLQKNYEIRIAEVGMEAHICNVINGEAEAGYLLQV